MSAIERHFRFTYTTKISTAQCAAHDVRLWVPLPSSDAQQDIGGLEFISPLPTSEGVEPETGNRMLSLVVPKGSADTNVVVRFGVRRRQYVVAPPPEDAAFEERFAPEIERHLQANVKVPLFGPAVEGARGAISIHDAPVARARALYSFIMDFLEYDMSGCTPEKQHELGNLGQACDLKKGTCTDFHGLYVSCARSLGLPARFAFGFNVPVGKSEGKVAGYHCWAEVYLPRVGWFPVDITEGIKRRGRGEPPENVAFFFGGLNPDRFELTRGRDVTLVPAPRGGALDKFIFSYAEPQGAGQPSAGDAPLDPHVAFSFQDVRG